MTREQSAPRDARARRPGARAGIDTADVVAAARAVYERDGVNALTMREVARELGVAPNALYSHVPGKEGLVDLLIDALLADIPLPAGRARWDAAIVKLMSDSRAVLSRHQALMPQFMSRPTTGPNALGLGEALLGQLARGGVEGAAAVTALRLLLVYTLGFVAMELPRAADADKDARRLASEVAFTTAGARSKVLARQLSQHPETAAFETGLRWLLAGIAADAAGTGERR